MVIERGHKWKAMEIHFPGKTDIQLKNRYNIIILRQQRFTNFVFGRPRKDRSTIAHSTANPADENTRGIEVEAVHADKNAGRIDGEADWTPEWTVEDFSDPESWDSWMGTDFASL
jgi:hypothetical protein